MIHCSLLSPNCDPTAKLKLLPAWIMCGLLRGHNCAANSLGLRGRIPAIRSTSVRRLRIDRTSVVTKYGIAGCGLLDRCVGHRVRPEAQRSIAPALFLRSHLGPAQKAPGRTAWVQRRATRGSLPADRKSVDASVDRLRGILSISRLASADVTNDTRPCVHASQISSSAAKSCGSGRHCFAQPLITQVSR